MLIFPHACSASQSTNSVSHYLVKLWQMEEGLPNNSIQALAQTPDGYLWVGSRKGLARFNGIEFKVFTSIDTPQLRSSDVTSLLVTRSGRMWVGTAKGGLASYQNGVFTSIKLDSAAELFLIKSLFEDARGTLWINTEQGLYGLESDRGSFLPRRMGIATNEIIRAVSGDGTDTVWVGTSDSGIHGFKEGNETAVYNLTNGLPHNSVRSLCHSRSGTLWVGTMSGVCGLKKDGSFDYYTTKSGLATRVVTALFEDSSGGLWIGTDGGLNHLEKGKLTTEFTEGGGAFGSVSAVFEDSEGSLWVATNEGLYRMRRKMFDSYTTQQGLSHNNVTSVIQDRAGSMWLGTWGGGVTRIDDGTLTSYSLKEGFSRDLVLALCQDHSGRMWAGSDLGGGLHSFTTTNNRAHLVSAGLSGTVRVIFEDSENRLWAGTSTGLYLAQSNQWVRYSTKEGLPHDTVRSLLEDHEGNLWVGTAGGIACLKDGSILSVPESEMLKGRSVLALHEDKKNDLWIVTTRGLGRLSKGKKLVMYRSAQGLYDDELYSVLEDDRGLLWVTCSKGLFSIPLASFGRFDSDPSQPLACTSYGKNDGLPSTQISGVGQPSACKDRDGRLWFPSLRGVAMLSPDTRVDRNKRIPPVYVETVFADKKSVERAFSGRDTAPLDLKPDSPRYIIPLGHGDLEFHYAALSLSAPEQNRYRYQLSGVDAQWVDASTRRVAYYNNLSPGTYQFRVKGCNDDGIWNEEGVVITMMLLPHFWQTFWFRTLCLAGLVGLVVGVTRNIEKRKSQRKIERLQLEQAMEKERARIARDIHDDLGGRLTKISKLTEQAQRDDPSDTRITERLNDIHGTAQEMLGRLDETVWAVNPRNDRLDHLADYILHYAEEFFRNTEIRCYFKVDDNIPPIPIAAEPRHHLFLAVKEALNNAARHSKATEVRLLLHFNQGIFKVVVEDNGEGFDVVEAAAKGSGIENMRHRLEQLNGRLLVESTEGKGSVVCLQFTPALAPQVKVESNRP